LCAEKKKKIQRTGKLLRSQTVVQKRGRTERVQGAHVSQKRGRRTTSLQKVRSSSREEDLRGRSGELLVTREERVCPESGGQA